MARKYIQITTTYINYRANYCAKYALFTFILSVKAQYRYK